VENINDVIKICPIVLDKEDKDVQDLALFYLPYSTGFEIECECKEDVNKFEFQKLQLLHLDINSSEQRFRIQNGIEGLCQLYNIAKLLPTSMYFNDESGIHYHIDCTDIYDKLNKDLIKDMSEYILNELDTWEYKGTYNSRKCEFSEDRNYTRFKSLTKTMEFRIGEMTFDYEVLFKRITHCNSIVREIKNKINYNFEEDIVIKDRIIKI